MSYTIIYKVPKTGEVEEVANIKNAWRGAVNIWQELQERYIPDVRFNIFDCSRVWKLADNDAVLIDQRIVLMTTFDYVMVKRENIQRVIDAMSSWGLQPGSLPEQIDVLKQLIEDDECCAVCWCQTSVSDDMWEIYLEDDAIRMYDISRDTDKHWFLFDELT